LFKVNLKLATANKPGMLAKIAAGIAQANSNIDHISMEESDNSAYTNIMFTVQIENRVHLADLMRKLRRIPEVVRINRVKGTGAEQRAQ
jgi:GTP pyrophosphokinase